MNRLYQYFIRIQLAVLLMGALFATSGCVNLDPVGDDTAFHVLGGSRETRLAEGKSRLQIRRVVLADYLQSSMLIKRAGNNELTYLSNHRWAGSLENMVADVCADALEKAHEGLFVTTVDSGQTGKWMSVHVGRFELLADDRVAVLIEYRLGDSGTREILSEGRFERISDTAAPSIPDAVTLLEDILQGLIADIAL